MMSCTSLLVKLAILSVFICQFNASYRNRISHKKRYEIVKGEASLDSPDAHHEGSKKGNFSMSSTSEKEKLDLSYTSKHNKMESPRSKAVRKDGFIGDIIKNITNITDLFKRPHKYPMKAGKIPIYRMKPKSPKQKNKLNLSEMTDDHSHTLPIPSIESVSKDTDPMQNGQVGQAYNSIDVSPMDSKSDSEGMYPVDSTDAQEPSNYDSSSTLAQDTLDDSSTSIKDESSSQSEATADASASDSASDYSSDSQQALVVEDQSLQQQVIITEAPAPVPSTADQASIDSSLISSDITSTPFETDPLITQPPYTVGPITTQTFTTQPFTTAIPLTTELFTTPAATTQVVETPPSCPEEIESLGCFADPDPSARVFPVSILNKSIDQSLEEFLCTCANEVLGKGWFTFSLQKDVCYSGPDESHYSKKGDSSQCFNESGTVCGDDDIYCQGSEGANSVYSVITPSHPKVNSA